MSLHDLLRNKNRTLALRGQMTLPSGRDIALSGSDIISLSVSEGVSDGMLLGSCPAASLRLTLADPDGDYLYLGDKRGASLMTGARIRLFLTVQDEANVWHDAPLGVFYITECTGTENSIYCQVQATDALGAFGDTLFSDSLTYPCTLSQLAQHMASQLGMTVNTDFPSHNMTVDTPPDFEGFTVRRALSCLASACASFVHVDREGNLCITPVRDPDSQTPFLLESQNTLSRHYGDASFGPLAALRVQFYQAPRKAEDAVKLYTDTVGVRPDALLDLSGNPLLPYGQSWAASLANACFYHMKGYTLTRASLSWQGDPALMLGRCVQMTDKRGQVTVTHVTRQTLAFNRGFSMQTECTVRGAASNGAATVLSPAGGVKGSSITGGIHGNLILDGSLGVSALKARSITADYIAASAIDTVHLTANAVKTDQLDAGAVTADKIGAGEITAVHIAGKTITADQLAAGLITAESGLIAKGAIGNAQIADGSITSAKIVSLNADVIDTGTLKADRLLLAGEGGVIYELNVQSSGLSLSELQKEQYKNYLNGTVIVARSITAAQLAAKTITANEILSGTITAAEIKSGTITAEQIAAHSITANRLASDVGSSLDLSSNESINLLVKKAAEEIADVYVQFDEPTECRKGDLWINTGNARWQDLQKMSWSAAAACRWGEFHHALHKTRIWDGSKWEVLVDQAVILDQETRIRQTEANISLMATKQELDGKVSRTEYDQDAKAISLRVQTVEEHSGKAETVQNTAMTLDSTGIHMKTGGTFTVESGNFDVDENGNVSMNDASVNGELLNSGQPVLTARNLVVSSTQPQNPIVGTVWVKPVGAVVASFVYNNTSVISFEKMEDAHTLTNLGSPTAASGAYTWNVSIPYKVLSPVTATRYLRMTVNGHVLFDEGLSNSAGSYTLQKSGTLTSWLGNAETLTFTLELHFLEGSESYLHNVHRLNTGAVELNLTAATDAAGGWLATEVQVYNG